jgi:hypothetical protein
MICIGELGVLEPNSRAAVKQDSAFDASMRQQPCPDRNRSEMMTLSIAGREENRAPAAIEAERRAVAAWSGFRLKFSVSVLREQTRSASIQLIQISGIDRTF